MKTNILKELLGELSNIDKSPQDIVAIRVGVRNPDTGEWDTLIKKECPTIKDLEVLNQSYDSGYGLDNLEGTVLFSDGSWLSREEYDGAEWWTHMSQPSISDILK